MSDKNYGSWSLDQIKAELRKRNAKVTGKKAVLVQRLHDYDQLFGDVVNNPDSSYKITMPAADKFRDITSDTIVPSVSRDDLVKYAAMIEREDLVTSSNMYEENFLLASRLAYDDKEGMYFVTAICGSEMRKNVTYNVILKLQDHLIIEGQCECAAGMGPHPQCKHLLVLIYGLIDFTKNKKIKRKSTCTDTLQSFHHPSNVYSGNPVRAENLTLKQKDDNYKRMTIYDPRPTSENKENFVRNFQQSVVNFCSTYNNTMPFMTMLKSANKKALYHDHDYLEKTAEEMFIESLKLNEENIKTLEKKTREKKVWKKERLWRIQSSVFGKVCKCKQTNKKKLARSLLIDLDINTAPMQHGKKYEIKGVKAFEQMTGLKTEPCGIFINAFHQFLGSTPDRLVEEDGVLEIKCPYSCRYEKITPETVDYLYLCERTGDLKLQEHHDYYYQVQGQLYCTQRKFAFFCVYTFKDFVVIKIERNELFIKSMLEKIISFYNQFYREALLDKYLYNVK